MKLNSQPQKLPLISESYRSEQERMHETTLYGTASILYAPIVSGIIDRMEITHLLDYGCGSRLNLPKHLKVKQKLTYQAYDPAVPKFSKPAIPAQMVACIDVLEHIEPELLDNVLDDLVRLTEGIAFLTVCTAAAFKTLPDGRNAHLTQQPIQWWLSKLWDRWELQTVQRMTEYVYFFIGTAKTRLEALDGSLL
jgi:hypothetical protein